MAEGVFETDRSVFFFLNQGSRSRSQINLIPTASSDGLEHSDGEEKEEYRPAGVSEKKKRKKEESAGTVPITNFFK